MTALADVVHWTVALIPVLVMLGIFIWLDAFALMSRGEVLVLLALGSAGALVAWLPPGEMTGEIHEFDARAGGGYRMSLFYPPTERSSRGSRDQTPASNDRRAASTARSACSIVPFAIVHTSSSVAGLRIS